MSAEERCCPGHGSMAHARGCVHHPERRFVPLPGYGVAYDGATPDAGDASEVEALAEAVWNAMPAHHVGWRGLKGDQRAFYIGIAERLLPHIAAREAAARAEERERIAQAIEADANTPPKGSLNHRAYVRRHTIPYDERNDR